MSLFKDNENFYPTPKDLISRMVSKVEWNLVKTVLEPSAGKGDIIEYLRDSSNLRYYRPICFAIEQDPNLQAILRSKDINVIDTDFLEYQGLEQFDLIIANPPFDDGDKHLLRMIDVMFSGQIVCLLNAETIKNPYSNIRKHLIQKLNELGAEIEYIKNAFVTAERKTNVETALIYIKKIQDVETALFNDMKEGGNSIYVDDIEEKHEVAKRDNIHNIVLRYNRDKEAITNQIMEFYKNYKAVGKYLNLSVVGESVDKYAEKPNEKGALTKIMKERLNNFAKTLKYNYWKETFSLDEVKQRLTSKKRDEAIHELQMYSNMEFTESNIRQFIVNMVKKFPKMIDEAIEYLFDEFTGYAIRAKDRNWGENEYLNNIHYFNGWKTNNAYKINKKVIIPFRLDSNYRGGYRLGWNQEVFLNDLDMVMGYFACEKAMSSTAQIIKDHLESGLNNRKIPTPYFYVSIFKKGTMHLEFRDEDLLRRFNIAACKGKNMLPHDYSHKPFKDLNEREKVIVKEFEGEKEYKQVESVLSIGSFSQNMLLDYKGGLKSLKR